MQNTQVTSNIQSTQISPSLVTSELKTYLHLIIEQNYTKKDIMLVPGMEYMISFFDPDALIQRTVRALIVDVSTSAVKVKVMTQAALCNTCANKSTCPLYNKTSTAPMPTCGCILNPPTVTGYEEPEFYWIATANIIAVNYILAQPVPPEPKGGTKVMIVGIQAHVIRAIVVNLAFLDDCLEEAVKYVELHEDGIYDIDYEENGVIYQVRGKIINIIDDPNPDVPAKGDRNCFVREHVGCHDHVYGNKQDFYTKDKNPKNIQIVLDTSEKFEGHYESIRLSQIRNCNLVGEDPTGGVEPENPNPDKDNNTGCCCKDCPYKRG